MDTNARFITLKHNGNCSACWQPMQAGTRALWTERDGPRHTSVAECRAAKALADAAAWDVLARMDAAGEEHGR